MTQVSERKSRSRKTERVVHFDLEGAWLADLARTRVEEGAWDRALKLLLDSLHGMTHEQAEQILRGRATLTGWASDKDGLGFEVLTEEHPVAQQMDEVHQRLYGEIFAHGDDYWEPYAIVQGYCKRDMQFAWAWEAGFRSEGYGLDSSDRYSALRALFYADDQRSDMVVYVDYPSADHGTVVLCRKAKMPPTWVRVSTDTVREVLRKQLGSGKRWEMRGAEYSGLDDDEEDTGLDALPRSRTPEPPTRVEDANEMAKEFLSRLNQTTSAADIHALGKEFDWRFDKMRRNARTLDVDAPLNDAENQAHERLLHVYRTRIAEQADEHGGWLELKVTHEDGTLFDGGRGQIRVPKHPFLLWCLKGFDFEANGKERPRWSTVCPMGMKMLVDDPFHTDWVVGAGLDPEKTYALDDTSYERRVQDCAFMLRSKVVSEWAKADFVTLARGKETSFYGEVVQPQPNEPVPAGSIAVVPTAGPEFQLAMETANKPGEYGRPGLIICNTGGKLAHLAVVGREFSCTVLMVPNATERFRQGMRLSVNLKDGSISWTL